MKKMRTKKNKCLNHLLRGLKLTPKSAYEKYGSMRLSSIIFKLRKEGHNITTKIIKVKDRFGGICNVAEYTIKKNKKCVLKKKN